MPRFYDETPSTTETENKENQKDGHIRIENWRPLLFLTFFYYVISCGIERIYQPMVNTFMHMILWYLVIHCTAVVSILFWHIIILSQCKYEIVKNWDYLHLLTIQNEFSAVHNCSFFRNILYSITFSTSIVLSIWNIWKETAKVCIIIYYI